MFSARSCSPAEMKILVPVRAIGAVAVRDGHGADEAEIRAALRLGQVHGPGPGSLDHLRDVEALLLLRPVREERGDRAHGQAGIHREGHVRRGGELVHDHVQRVGQALPAVFRGHRKADPAPGGVGRISLPKAFGRRDPPVPVPGAALEVADPVQGLQNLLAEPRPLRQDRLDRVGRGVGEAREVAVALDPENVVKQEQGVLDGRPVDRHRLWTSRKTGDPRGRRPTSRAGAAGGRDRPHLSISRPRRKHRGSELKTRCESTLPTGLEAERACGLLAGATLAGWGRPAPIATGAELDAGIPALPEPRRSPASGSPDGRSGPRSASG